MIDSACRKKQALLYIQSKASPETIKSVISAQKSDGSFKLSDTISKQLDVSSDEILTSVQSYVTSEKLKKTLDPSTWSTAVTLR